MTEIPTIETERLLLRPMTMADWPRYSELMQSDRSLYMGGPYSRAGAWGMFCFDIAQWELMGHGALMFDDRLTGLCLGQVGVNHGPFFPEHELGWFVYPEAEGKGYALEAAIAMRDWAYATLKLDTLVSYMDPDNNRSANLATRMGATLDQVAPRNEPRDHVYRHLKPSGQ